MKNLTFCLLVLFNTIIFVSCKKEKKAQEEVLRPVRYTTVGTLTSNDSRTFSGVAKAGNEIDLSFRSGGIITELNLKVGQTVKKGDLLAKLDNVQASLAYEQSLSTLRTAKSALSTAKSNLDRIKSLYEKGSNSLSDYEAARNSYQSALDQYESAEKSRSIQASQISYGVIKAAKDGVIAKKNSALNENVSAGQVIAVLNAGKEINVVVGLPESIINRITIGMKVILTFSSIDNKEFNGTVIEIAPVIDNSAATYPVKVDIIDPTEQIKPGMAAAVLFEFDDKKSRGEGELIIPLKAVGEDGNGNFVFLINTQDKKVGVVKKHSIEVGALTDKGFLVQKGLSRGDLITTAGLQTLLDGQKVRLQ